MNPRENNPKFSAKNVRFFLALTLCSSLFALSAFSSKEANLPKRSSISRQESRFSPTLMGQRISAPSADLSNSFAYPVPFIPSLGDTFITFTNLPPVATIKILTVSGELVRELQEIDGDGQLNWDVKNSRGESLGSDVYVYRIETGSNAKTGKIVVVK